MNQLIIQHNAMRKNGIVYLISAIVCSVIFWLLRDQFVKPYGTIVITGVVVFEYLIAIYTLLMSKGSEMLDQEGITSRNPLGVKKRLWTDLKKFEIGWQYGTTKAFGMKNEKLPYIRLVFTNPYADMRFPYREDIDQHIRHYWGRPTKDTWTKK